MHLPPDLEALEDLRHQIELGWQDLDADHVTDFDPEDIKRRGRERLAQKNRRICDRRS